MDSGYTVHLAESRKMNRSTSHQRILRCQRTLRFCDARKEHAVKP